MLKRILLFSFFVMALCVMAGTLAAASGQRAVAGNGGDVTIDGFTFKLASNVNPGDPNATGFITIIDAVTKATAGTIILNQGGRMVAPMPAYVSKGVEAAVDKYFASFTSGSAEPAKDSVSATAAATRATVQFDAANDSVIVPMGNGESITFNKDQTITLVGGSKFIGTYLVEHRKGSAGGAVASIFGGSSVKAGGASSLAGGGPVITFVAPGGGKRVMYDDQKGTVYRGQNAGAKAIAQEIIEASKRVEQESPEHAQKLPKQLLGEMKVLTDLRD